MRRARQRLQRQRKAPRVRRCDPATTDQVSDRVTDHVKALLKCLGTKPASALECMKKLGLSHRLTFHQNDLQPALVAGLIERTLPDKPSSRLRR